jgi:hypothetical protein
MDGPAIRGLMRSGPTNVGSTDQPAGIGTIIIGFETGTIHGSPISLSRLLKKSI